LLPQSYPMGGPEAKSPPPTSRWWIGVRVTVNAGLAASGAARARPGGRLWSGPNDLMDTGGWDATQPP
jgi:hypothetical protein